MSNMFRAFADELEKIATDPALSVNRAFGLPLSKQPPRGKRVDSGSSARAGRADTATTGDAAPATDMVESVKNPSQGPGGV